MSKQTALHAVHVAAGASMVDFAGWQMPMHYGSQLTEHRIVRSDAGMFDVSHMTVIDVSGTASRDYLRYVLANDVDKLKTTGKALYSCLLNEQGGVIDDLIVYYFSDTQYRLVVNAATREKDLAWLQQQASLYKGNVELHERDDLAMIAVQGPKARAMAATALPANCRDAAQELPPFTALRDGDWLIARTGYTGEDGFEVLLPNSEAVDFWQALLANGVQPAGLGARDTLRLEAGMALYGNDMDESVNPLTSGLGWTVAFEPATRDFIGRQALTQAKADPSRQAFVGLVLLEKGVLRRNQAVRVAGESGVITSGGFSPTLEQAIALARVPQQARQQATCEVDIRGKWRTVQIVKPPFVRHGQPVFKAMVEEKSNPI